MGELGPLSPLWSLGRTWKLVFPVPCALLPLGLGVPMRTLLPVPSPALEGAGQSFLSPVSTVAEPDGWNTRHKRLTVDLNTTVPVLGSPLVPELRCTSAWRENFVLLLS